jgi:chromate reductase, NAD(P)H dehydrogenase (quinone)
MPPLSVLGLAGSLRAGSHNRALLEAAGEVAPPGLRLTVHDLGDLPLYNGDLDTDDLRPEPVARLKAAVAEADALLIATPEYNHGVPGVLHNALDWASRPARRSPLAGKPVGVMGASSGVVGTARAQEQLKLLLLSTLALPLPHPGVLVGRAAEKFEGGRLTDERTRDFLAEYLRQLEAWTRRLALEPAADPHA